jgi:hypothetical protein
VELIAERAGHISGTGINVLGAGHHQGQISLIVQIAKSEIVICWTEHLQVSVMNVMNSLVQESTISTKDTRQNIGQALYKIFGGSV